MRQRFRGSHSRYRSGPMMRRAARRTIWRTRRYHHYPYRPFSNRYYGYRYSPLGLRARIMLIGVILTISIIIITIMFVIFSPNLLG